MTGNRSGASRYCTDAEDCLWGILEADCIFCSREAWLKNCAIYVIDNVHHLATGAKSEAIRNTLGGILKAN